MGFAMGPLLLVIGLCPPTMSDGLPSKLMEGLPEKGRAKPAPVRQHHAATPFHHRWNADKRQEVLHPFIAAAVRPQRTDQTSGMDPPRPR
jgi:hypothetical protein